MLKTNSQNYSIGVVTYVNRYNTYFRKNIKNLVRFFPDKEIICIINGHPDKERHLSYLKEITGQLSSFKNVKYITFEDHQSLAKCWNWITLMSSNPNFLFLNDDILIKKNFRGDFESHLQSNTSFFTVNGSFSHFLLNKDTVKKNGWFDERFLGVGQEDGDYLLRLAQNNIPLINVECSDILNFVAPNDNPGFKKISSLTQGKYSSINKEFMQKKWFFNHLTQDNFIPEIEFVWKNEMYRAALKPNMETPEFYDFSLLNNVKDFAPSHTDLTTGMKDIKTKLRSLFKFLKKRNVDNSNT